MADVASAFIQGHQAALSEQEHQQAIEDNKLRSLVLKHQLDSLKIDSQLRAREIAHQQYQLMQGQPAAEIPSEPNPDSTLPTSSLAGMMSAPPGQPGVSLAAPAAQPPAQPMTRPQAMTIPGIDASEGAPAVPSISLRPRSLEDLVRAQTTAEMQKSLTGITKLDPEQSAYMLALGPHPIATNTATKPKDEWATWRDTYPKTLGKSTWESLTPQQQQRGFQAFTQSKVTPEAQATAALAQELTQARIGDEAAKKAPIDITPEITTSMLGSTSDQPLRYLDASAYTKEEIPRARKAAEAAGVAWVPKETAQGLEAANRAAITLDTMWTQLKDFLPADASGRLVGGPANTLGKVFQTNPTLGAFGTWRTAAVQSVQALAEKGMGLRLNQAEISNLLEGLPKITDDAPTALQKMLNIRTQLETKVRSALTKNQTSLAVPGGMMGPPAQASVPTAPAGWRYVPKPGGGWTAVKAIQQ